MPILRFLFLVNKGLRENKGVIIIIGVQVLDIVKENQAINIKGSIDYYNSIIA